MHKWNPADYARHSAAQLAWARELVARLKLRGDESVLDIGSGDGKVSAEIAAALPEGRVVGLDGSQEMIEFARANYGRERFANLEFVCTDARKIALQGLFDIVFSNAALHWIEDHLAVLSEMSRVLRSGGRIIISNTIRSSWGLRPATTHDRVTSRAASSEIATTSRSAVAQRSRRIATPRNFRAASARFNVSAVRSHAARSTCSTA